MGTGLSYQSICRKLHCELASPSLRMHRTELTHQRLLGARSCHDMGDVDRGNGPADITILHTVREPTTRVEPWYSRLHVA